MSKEEIKQEKITLLDAIREAIDGNPDKLSQVLLALTEERDNLMSLASQRLAKLNGQIELLQSIQAELKQ